MERDGHLTNTLYMLRASKRWSQQELAERLGVSRQTVASIEANKYNPSLILGFKIAHLFGVDINEVFQFASHHPEEE
ncbi:helix-turn-helix transcriptional regulator [Paenibacillus sp. FJAT-26967]|uniref:helix-turn-helix transcriptional regulator n=1 Tax=Paenibacillus sp. FJAT-26967 TaxID=1729690 RepID=UPI000839890A|nr:helix-turn-helix transcriptional regulator [Paenibacillus sp. FJAT-26967]